ncbi:hypothetical protein C9374_011921 [Naegleria lovaniensis]|uniref:Uncharacterized protein n=1 Tax=Naegleria lovaniensis TaxID=51637 RepID=A0AA88GDL6_NAELO|nr:uncharacterized protein C9374_011921 [Naegleria lovaniensis]KAG2373632.1 hypothetical protein C9374_011921 [Naegleria lovaniensis]
MLSDQTTPIASYKVQFLDGHIIMEIPNQNKESLYALVDTGSPMTLSSEYSTLGICGKKFKVKQMHDEASSQLSTKSISKYINFNVQYLLGNDIMQDYHLELSRECIRFFNKSVHSTRLSNPNEENNVLEIELTRISYISAEWVQDERSNYEPLGTEEDFHPTMGKFMTSLYRVPLHLTSCGKNSQVEKTFVLKCGTLPSQLSYMLSSFHVDGIFGSELLNDCQRVFITHDRMYICL